MSRNEARELELGIEFIRRIRDSTRVLRCRVQCRRSVSSAVHSVACVVRNR